MSAVEVGNSSSDNGLGRTQPITDTHGDRSMFRLGDALLETAIAVTCARVGHAHTDEERDQAFQELENLRSQRECRGLMSRAGLTHTVQSQLCTSIDNQIQDCLHEQLDAERACGGQTLDEFLAVRK
jgi:hypothetical protein